jgi:hypothetical protein
MISSFGYQHGFLFIAYGTSPLKPLLENLFSIMILVNYELVIDLIQFLIAQK